MLEYLIRVLFFIVIKESLTALLSFLQYSEYIKKRGLQILFFETGALQRIRTSDPQLRRLLLYPAELGAQSYASAI